MEPLLFLAHRLPYPPNKGDKIRSYHLLKFLAQRYRVHLATFIDDPDDWQHVDAVKSLCASTYIVALNPSLAKIRSLTALAGGKAMSLDYYRNAGMQRWVRKTVDVHHIRRVVVFSSVMAQYAEHMTAARRIVDFVDIDSDKWRQYAEKKAWPMNWLYAREARTLLQYERRIAHDFNHALFVSRAEADDFKRLAPESASRTGHFSNGVDTEYFSPDRHYDNPYWPDEVPVTFTGAMDYWPNVDAVQWFADEVLPLLLKQQPQVRFYIVGSRPAAQVQALALQPGIVVTGTVPDVRPYLAHARACIAPLRIARGIQNKVLEAMAMAKPVAVSEAALEGIDAQPGKDVLRCRSALEFAEELFKVLAEPHDVVGPAARRTVLARYGWAANLAPVASLMEMDATDDSGRRSEGPHREVANA